MAQALAHGELPKWHTIGGLARDRRWMPAVRHVDRWMAAHQEWLVDRKPLGDVAVVWSPRTVRSQGWRGHPQPSHRAGLVGWYLALTRAQLPFEIVHEEFLTDLERFKVLVLPTGLGLPADAVAAIEEFARAGGGIVGCCRALATDEWGRPRGSRSSVLRVEEPGALTGPLSHAAIDVRDAERLGVGLGDTDLINSGRWMSLPAGWPRSARLEGRLIGDYPISPTHRIVAPEPDPRRPAFVASDGIGGAPAVYIAADLDAAYAEHVQPDHALVLTNAVHLALGDHAPAVDVRGEGFADVRPWRHPHGVSVFLVNLDNAATAGGVVTDLRPLGRQEVDIRLPAGERATSVRLLRRDSECTWHQAQDVLTVTVPEINDFEVIAATL